MDEERTEEISYDYDALCEKIKPGSKWRVFFSEGNMNNHLAHIRAIVDDEWVVWRKWVGGRWFYKVDYIHYFYLLDGDGLLRKP